jgi:hypothetical protein
MTAIRAQAAWWLGLELIATFAAMALRIATALPETSWARLAS